MSLQNDIIRCLAKGPLTSKQLKGFIDSDARKLEKALRVLTAKRKVKIDKKGRFYAISNGQNRDETEEVLAARIVKLARTFAFASPLDQSADIFIPGRGLTGALPGDEVEIALYKHPRVPGSREGNVVRVTKPNERFVGMLEMREGRLYFIPESVPDVAIAVKRNMENGAAAGEMVAVLVTRGADYDQYRAEVVSRFGAGDTAQQSAKAILYMAGIQKSFPEKAKKQAKFMAELGVSAEEAAGRKDLRREPIFTIDSDSTKDIDDAISAARDGDGYTLGVHIADVSYYVQANTPLDEEALHRGTSVYYADSVVPMLPKALSNGICSLNPQEDRLAFSCLTQLDADGRLIAYRFEKTLICSKVKGVYDEVNALFAGDKSKKLAQKYREVSDSLAIMREIYEKLAKLRAARGSMEIESDEPNLVIDENGRCVGIARRQRGDAERLIEEFMLLANTAAAKQAKEWNIPFVYRVHEKPLPDKVEGLKLSLTAIGVPFRFRRETPTQKELGKILDDTRGSNKEKFVHNAVLRSMAKAKYEPRPVGHYGLALVDYAHFTSPIRRYPDLAIHRILSDMVNRVPAGEVKKKYKEFARMASLRSSETEITAQKVERDCDACYKAEYMKPFLGQSFDGVISSVMQFGIYVELPNTVEGLVHVSRLPGDALSLVEGISLSNPVTGQSYRVGDSVRVVLVGVDIPRGHIDFDLESKDNLADDIG